MLVLPLALELFWLRAGASPLDYRNTPFQAEMIRTEVRRDRTEYELRFPSPLKSHSAANNTVWGHLSLPRGTGPFPCILVLPIMAAPNVWIEQRFINRFRRDGFAVLWLEMPYQFHRRPDRLVPSGQVFLARTAKGLAFNFRQSVLDARRALAWLSRCPSVDPKRIGIFGISLGAMVGAAAYAVDPVPKRAAFMLGGADFPGLVLNSSMTGPYVRKFHIKSDELREAWRGLDPLDYKERNREKPALLINTRSDTVVPLANALKLREAFPRGRQLWIPFGHYSAVVHLIWGPSYVSRYFRSNL